MCTSGIAHSPQDLEFVSIILKVLISSPVHPQPTLKGWLLTMWGSQCGGRPPIFKELEPDAKGWKFIDHNLWVVRQHHKVQIVLHQIGLFSAYAIFGISDHAAEKSTEHLISRDCYRRSSYEVPRESRPHWVTVWPQRAPSLIEPDRTAELLLRKTIHQETDIHCTSILRNNSYSVAKGVVLLAFSWIEDIIKHLSKLTAVPFLKICLLMAHTLPTNFELFPAMTYEEGWSTRSSFKPNFLSYHCP